MTTQESKEIVGRKMTFLDIIDHLGYELQDMSDGPNKVTVLKDQKKNGRLIHVYHNNLDDLLKRMEKLRNVQNKPREGYVYND